METGVYKVVVEATSNEKFIYLYILYILHQSFHGRRGGTHRRCSKGKGVMRNKLLEATSSVSSENETKT